MAKKVDIKVRLTGAEKAQKGFQKLGSSISGTILKVGGALIAFAALKRAFTAIIGAYAIQELAEKKLATALGHTSQALLDQASALQKTTAVGDEVIIGVQASIAAFIKDEDQIKKTTIAVLDLAAGMNIDLKSAGDLVSKSIGSTTNALKRMGIEVSGAVGSLERLTTLTKGVEGLYGGQAAAFAETLAGKIKILTDVFGDFFETLGGFVAGPLVPILKFLTNTILFVDKATKSIGNMFEILFADDQGESIIEETNKDLGVIIVKLTDAQIAYIDFKEKIQEAAKATKQLTEFQFMYNKELGRLAVSPLGELPDEMERLKETIEEVTGASEDMADVYVSEVVEKMRQANENFANSFAGTMQGAFQSILVDGQNAFKAIGDAFKQMLIQMAAQIAARAAIFALFKILSIPLGGFSILPFAHGGRPAVNQPSLVGEEGPELFVPDVAGTIIPNNQIGQNIIVNITGNVLTKDFVEDQVIPQIQTAIRRAG